MPHYSPTPAQVDAWNNLASLGFSTWKRHTTTGAVARIPLIQKKQHALETVYQRNASFTAGLIARQANRVGFDSGNTNFVFRLNRLAVSKYGNDHIRNTSNNLKPVRNGASDDITPNKTEQHHGVKPPRLPSMPDGADRNNPLMRKGITMSGGYYSPGSIIPNSTIARSTSRNSVRSLDADEATTSMRDGLNLRRVSSHKNDTVDSAAIKPSENIARSTVFSESRIPATIALAETHDHSRSNTNVMHAPNHTHSFSVSEAEPAFYKPVFSPSNALPRSLVRRSPVSLHSSSTDLSTSQRFPLKISPMAITRLLRTSHASLATEAPARSEWLPINHQTLFKTVNRQIPEKGGAKAGLALPENSGYDHIGKSATRLTPHSIARSSETEIRRTSGFGPVLNLPGKSSPVTDATPEAAKPYAPPVTPDFQGSPKGVDVNSSVLTIARVIQPGPIYISALPERSKDNFHRTPLQRQIRNGLPIGHTHVLQRLSQVTAPDTHASPFRAHQHSIARSSETEIRRIRSFGPVLNPPVRSSPVTDATPEAAEPHADSITPDFQDSPKGVDINSSVPSIEPAILPGPIYKSALPQRSKDDFHRTPLQRQIRNGLPIHHAQALQRLSQVAAPDAHASPSRMHQHDNLLPLHKIIAQRSSSVASTYFASTLGATGKAPQGHQFVTSTYVGHIPFNTATHPTAGIGGAQRAMERSQSSLNADTAPHTGMSSRFSRLTSPVPPIAVTGGNYLSLKQEQQFTNPLASRPASAQSAHSLANLVMPRAITDTISRINRSIGHSDRFFGSAAPSLPIHGLEAPGAGYAPAPGVTTNLGATSSALDATGTDTAPTAATASGFDPALHVIKRFTQITAGAPPMLRRLEKNLNPRFLTLSHATRGRTAPGVLARQPTTASNASISFPADVNLADSPESGRAFRGDPGTFGKSKSGAVERPLAMVQRMRMPAQLMRMLSERTSDEPHHDLLEDRHGVVPAPYQVSRQVSDAIPDKASGTAASPSGKPDSEEIAEHAWRMMAERLVIEQERRGLAKWP